MLSCDVFAIGLGAHGQMLMHHKSVLKS